MTTKRMLVDASHPEETRVVVIDGSRLEDFDVEVSTKRQLKGNIYLAKVTRVEPSLQAAFVDYGGNRHGFLAFNEIHPDYYQIPVADREALLAEQEAADRAAEAAAGEDGEGGEPEDDDEFERRRPRVSSRHYKIQEVIKRRQIMLVQVVKEERGTKGAALTTYLSLAGRYCVLMPNTSRGGGISRKITSATDRKRLKKILAELEIPHGMAVIVRTAGSGRSKAEVKRDYEYLLRLWSNIREMTLKSMAPALVYEEASLIKRSIRDLYGREIEEIIIQGEPEYRIAKEFMKLFIPSHAKRVKLYDTPDTPLFQHYGVENQLEQLHQMTVHLRSGGYLVFNPTEALVAIDVNSGRATRERHIEETALRTNLEAADEVARQLRLRDFAGLIVIDFIDMENPRNQAQVERRMKEAMKNDKARVQLGRISAFGLLELSRQRLRPSVLETSFETCAHCGGAGMRRTTESIALAILRKCEEEGINRRATALSVTVPTTVALYLLNHKRRPLSAIEERYGLVIRVTGDDTVAASEFRIERTRTAAPAAAEAEPEDAVEPAAAVADDSEPEAETADREDGGKRSRRRRPRRRRRPGEERDAVEASAEAAAEEEPPAEPGIDEEAEEPDEAGEAAGIEAEPRTEADDAERKRRRRGRRGGRRRARRPAEGGSEDASIGEEAVTTADATEVRPEVEAVIGVEAGVEAEAGASAAGAAAAEAWDEPEPVAEAGERPEPAAEPLDEPAAPAWSDEPLESGQAPAESSPPSEAVADEHPRGGGDEPDAPATGVDAQLGGSGGAGAGAEPERGDAVAELIVPAAEQLGEAVDAETGEHRRSARIIEVGEAGGQATGGSGRRGWWQRFLD